MNPLDKSITELHKRPMASDIAPEWLHQVRAVIVRDNHKLRAGFPLSIEVHGPKDWQPLNLPTNGTEFLTVEDRDKVLAWLDGSAQLPELPVPC